MKVSYQSPEMDVVFIDHQAVICASGLEPGGNTSGFNNDGNYEEMQ